MHDPLSATDACRYCRQDIWWDDSSETYETADEDYTCQSPDSPDRSHDAAV